MSKKTAQKTDPLADKVKALEAQNQLLHQYLETVKNLYWASQKIASSKNFLYDLNQLLYQVMGVVDAKDGSISRLDFKTNELVFVLVHGELGRQLPDYRIKADTGIAGWVIKNQKPIIVNDPRLDKRFSQIVDSEFGFFTNSIVSAPIMRRGQLRGVVQLLNKHGNEFNEDDVALLLILGQVAALIFEQLGTEPLIDNPAEDEGLMPTL